MFCVIVVFWWINTPSSLLQIRVRRIHMFLGLLDPDSDPLVKGTDPDPSIIKQK
jgi:hypothetical protein